MDKKLKRLMKGHVVQIKHNELENLPHDIFDDVNSNIIMKAHMKGKGVRLQLSGNEAEVLGGKIKWGKVGKKIANTAKSVGKDIKDAGMDAKQYLGNTEDRKYGKNIMKIANWQNKNLQKIANSSLVQNSPFGNTIGALAEANNQGVEFLGDFHKARKEKGGLGKDLLNATKANVKRKVNTAVNDAVSYGRDEMSNALNSYMGGSLTGDIKGALLNAYGQEKKKLKGQVKKQVLSGIDYAQNEGKQKLQNRIKTSQPYISAQEKIANELAKGGSFRPNGGSFRPNGGSFRGNFSAGSFRGNGIHIAGRPNAIGGSVVYDDQSPFLRPDQDAFTPMKPRSLKSQKGN